MVKILVLRRDAYSQSFRSDWSLMYAIVQTGGKQYRVSQGDLLQVELLDPGQEKVEFSQVFLVSNGRETAVGTPLVAGAKVTGSVVSTGRAPKILVFKKKRRKQYKRTIGHRQYFTAVRILDINSGGAVPVLENDTPAALESHQKTRARKAGGVTKKASSRKKPTARAKSSGKRLSRASSARVGKKTIRPGSQRAAGSGGKSKAGDRAGHSTRPARKPAEK